MLFPTLNMDVLEAILFWVLQEDLVNIMGTCRGMYYMALPYLLSSVECRQCRLPEFCAFMLMEKHGDRALPSLRSLSIYIAPRNVSKRQTPVPRPHLGPGLLTRVLQGACNLRTLNILCLLKMRPFSEPGVFRAIARLPCLSKITILDPDKRCLPMLSRTRVRHVNIRPNGAIAPIIQSLPATTEVLTMLHPRGSSPDDYHLPFDKEWPLVHTLQFQRLTLALAYLAHTFPNVHSLIIHSVWARRVRMPQIHSSWPRLQYIGVTTTALLDLRFPYPVRELYLSSKIISSPFHNQCPVLDVLGHVKAISPRALSVVGLQDPVAFLPKLVETLPDLRVLGLSLHAGLDVIAERMPSIMNLLQPLPLAYLMLAYAPQSGDKVSEEELLDCLMPHLLMPTIRILEITLDANHAINSLVREEGQHSCWSLSDVGKDGAPRRAEKISGTTGHQARELIMAGHAYV